MGPMRLVVGCTRHGVSPLRGSGRLGGITACHGFRPSTDGLHPRLFTLCRAAALCCTSGTAQHLQFAREVSVNLFVEHQQHDPGGIKC
jgi:hypothetical protein